MSLEVAYEYAEQPQKALQTYQEALQYKNIAPLLRARVLAEAGEVFARTCGSKAEALQYLGMSHEVYPNRPESDPTFLYADCPYPVLSLYQGLA